MPAATANLRVLVRPAPYLGKRVRLSGYLKTEEVAFGATLSIHVEGPDGVWLAAADRRVRGTTDWQKQDLVVDVPASGTSVALQVSMDGSGKAWVDGVTLGIVGPEVALTDWPGRWRDQSSVPKEYMVGGNPETPHGSPGGGFVRSKTPTTKEMGSLATWVVPSPYLGKRVRVSGYVRTEALERRAFLFVLVGGANDATLDLDSMGDRPIRGATDWKKYDAVVDVPAGAAILAYGLQLEGGGSAWIDGVTLEMVGPDVARTGGRGWFPTGASPEDYDMGGNPRVPHGAEGGGYVRSKVEAPGRFASWATTEPVAAFLGKRIRLSGYMRAEGADQAAIWMRVDGPNNQVLSFDNMDNRPVKGTTDWKKYEIVLDVPPQATNIMYGLMIYGRGKAWLDGLTLGPVGTDVPSTHMASPYRDYYAGRYDEAAAALPEVIARSPQSYSPRLIYFLSLHRSGMVKEAQTYISVVADSAGDKKWAAPVALLYAGRASEDDVLKAAASADPKTDNEQRCEAYYYLAMAYLLRLGNVQADGAPAAAKGREYLEKCIATGVSTFIEYRAAQTELQRMK